MLKKDVFYIIIILCSFYVIFNQSTRAQTNYKYDLSHLTQNNMEKLSQFLRKHRNEVIVGVLVYLVLISRDAIKSCM